MCGKDKRQKKKKIEWLLTGVTAALLLMCCGTSTVNAESAEFREINIRAQFAEEKDHGESHGSKALRILGLNENSTFINKLILLSR